MLLILIHDAPFLAPSDRSSSSAPTFGPSLDTVILRDEVPPPALALRGPTWPSGADSRLAASRAAPAEGHARGGTRRTPRPGRARQPDLLPLKGRSPDGGVAPEFRGSPVGKAGSTPRPRRPGWALLIGWSCVVRGGTSPSSLAPELAPTRSACVRRCGWGGAWGQTGISSCQL